MSTDNEITRPAQAEFHRLFEATGKTQGEIAAYLARATGSKATNYQVSRWLNGHTKIPVDVMDAMRAAAERPANDTAPPPAGAGIADSGEEVPLFGYANAAGSVLRLNDDQIIGVAPIHPAQRGSRAAFAFLVFGDSLTPMLNHGDTAYAIRGRTPRKGQPCVVQLRDGSALVKIFAGIDERTLFAEQLTPRKDLTIPLREVEAIHAVVSVSFG